jgi:hypothetical protein
MFCRCPISTGMFSIRVLECGRDVWVYPRMGLMSVHGKLLDVKHVPWGSHFWQEVLRAPYGVTRFIITKAPTIPMGWGSYIQIEFTGMDRHGGPVPCQWVCRGFGSRKGRSLLTHLHIIQKAIRRVNRVRNEHRTLAVAMGLHERLGGQSLINMLPAELMAAKIMA